MLALEDLEVVSSWSGRVQTVRVVLDKLHLEVASPILEEGNVAGGAIGPDPVGEV